MIRDRVRLSRVPLIEVEAALQQCMRCCLVFWREKGWGAQVADRLAFGSVDGHVRMVAGSGDGSISIPWCGDGDFCVCVAPHLVEGWLSACVVAAVSGAGQKAKGRTSLD